MKNIIAIVLLTASLGAQSQDATMTIYKDGYALVKQPIVWTMTPNSGVQTIQYKQLPSGLVQDSPFLSLDQGQVLGQRYFGNIFSGRAFFKTKVGEFVTVALNDGQEFSGTLIEFNAGQITLQTRRDVITISGNRVSTISTRAEIENPLTTPTLEWSVNLNGHSQIQGSLAYLSYGFDWNTHYRFILDEEAELAELISEAFVSNNSQMDFSNLNVQLVEGTLGRPGKAGPIRSGRARTHAMAAMEAAPPAPAQESLGDYHIYRPLQERVDFSGGESITVRIYDSRHVSYEKTYVFENTERSKREEPLVVEITVLNNEENNLNIPLPQGKVNLYYSKGGSLEFAGEDRLDQVPKGEIAEIRAGRAFDVIGKRRVLNYDRQHKSEEGSIEIRVTNTRAKEINVRLVEHIRGDWVIKEASANYTKKDASTIHFPLTVPPESSETITYTYRKEWK